jgi:amino acid transporter
MADDDQVVIEHPNRRKASSQLARLVVIVLLIASAAVVLIISIGGWVAIYLVFAIFVARWSRGVLPMIAALAVILGIFAAVAGPAWFDRDKDGFTDPPIGAGLLGLLCFLLLALQIALIIVAMIGFRQSWNVEVETTRGQRDPEPEPAAA